MTNEHKPGSPQYVDLGDELRARLRLIEAERARLVNALKAWENTPAIGEWFSDQPNLDGLTLKNAVIALLTHAEKHGKTELEARSILEAVAAHKVTTSRGGKLLSETKSPWMVLVRILTAPANKSTFHMSGQTQHKVSDVVSLVKQPSGRKAL